MSLFWKRKQHIAQEKQADIASAIEVIKIKRKAHESAIQTDRDITKLNNLLKANGITFKIHIANGGHRGH